MVYTDPVFRQLRLPKALNDRLTEIARRNGRSLNGLTVHILQQYVDLEPGRQAAERQALGQRS